MTIPTTAHVWAELSGQTSLWPTDWPRAGLGGEARAFHWPLEFPEAFAAGGFDVVLGNPPWERIKLQEQEFFASREPEIATAPNAVARRRMIDALKKAEEGTRESRLYDEFESAKRIAEASSVFARLAQEDHGRFPFTGRGDVNTYALFAELFAKLANHRGRAAVIVPTGIATDATTAPFFASLVEKDAIIALLSFENEAFIFPSVHHAFKFALLTTGWNQTGVPGDYCHFIRHIEQLSDSRRHFRMSANEIAVVNPNTRTAPVFRSNVDAGLTAKIYSHSIPIEGRGSSSHPWQLKVRRFLDMNRAEILSLVSGESSSERVPVYEGKMFWQFDHRHASYSIDTLETFSLSNSEKTNESTETRPRYWIDRKEVVSRLAEAGWEREWLIGIRDLTNTTNERTTVASAIPLAGTDYTIRTLLAPEPDHAALFLGCANSIVFDYVARTKLGGMHLAEFVFQQLPMLPPQVFTDKCLPFLIQHVLELTYTSRSMAPFAHDLGYDGPPFAWDEDRRALLRADLDAWYARAYGLSCDELRYILDPADVKGEDYPSETFRVLKNNEIKKFGEYRTRRLVLAAWDRLEQTEVAEAAPPAILAPGPLSMLPNRAWAMPSYSTVSVQLQLAAMLKALPCPTSADRVRLAALYALHPRYLTPYLSDTARKEWQRLVPDGGSASTPGNIIHFVPRVSIEWRDAYTQLRGMQALIEDSKNGTWAPGPAAQQFLTEGWPDGRAGFVLKAMEGMDIGRSVAGLPIEIQNWVKGHAA